MLFRSKSDIWILASKLRSAQVSRVRRVSQVGALGLLSRAVSRRYSARQLCFIYYQKLTQLGLSRFLSKLFKVRLRLFVHDVWSHLAERKTIRAQEQLTWRMTTQFWRNTVLASSGKWLVWLFIRSAAIAFQIYGTAHFLAKAVALLVKQNRRHFPLFRFTHLMLFGYVRTPWKSQVVHSVLIAVTGKVNGNMRATKYTLSVGRPRIFWIGSWMDFAMCDSFSLYGIMSVRLWIAFNNPINA